METEKNIRLTSAELSQLWISYQNDSGSICVLRYFLGTVEDSEIRPILEHDLQLSETHIQKLTSLFTEVSLEMTNLYANFQRNDLGTATLIGFSQVAKLPKGYSCGLRAN